MFSIVIRPEAAPLLKFSLPELTTEISDGDAAFLTLLCESIDLTSHPAYVVAKKGPTNVLLPHISVAAILEGERARAPLGFVPPAG